MQTAQIREILNLAVAQFVNIVDKERTNLLPAGSRTRRNRRKAGGDSRRAALLTQEERKARSASFEEETHEAL